MKMKNHVIWLLLLYSVKAQDVKVAVTSVIPTETTTSTTLFSATTSTSIETAISSITPTTQTTPITTTTTEIPTTTKPPPGDYVYSTDPYNPEVSLYRIRSYCRYARFHHYLYGTTNDLKCRNSGYYLQGEYDAYNDKILKGSITIQDLKLIKLQKGAFLPLYDLSRVHSLELSQTKTVTFEDGAFNRFEALASFKFYYNPLTHFNGQAFSKASAATIKKMDLSHNNLSTFSPNAFENFDNLVLLLLSRNHFLTNLTKETFPPSLSNLMVLDLAYCNISSLPINVFQHLVSLERLYLQNNPLISIPTAISRTPNLKILFMDGSAITVISQNPKFSSESLEVLSLNNSPNLIEIGPRAFVGFPNLQFMNISDNKKLQLVDEEAFGYPNNTLNLKQISFLNCNISVFPEKLLNWLSIELFWIEGNPIQCSCENAWLINDLQKENSRFAKHFWNYPRCVGPGEFTARKINAIFEGVCVPEVNTPVLPSTNPLNEQHYHIIGLVAIVVILGVLLMNAAGYLVYTRLRCRINRVKRPIHDETLMVDNINYGNSEAVIEQN